jgi:hypothetical protein
VTKNGRSRRPTEEEQTCEHTPDEGGSIVALVAMNHPTKRNTLSLVLREKKCKSQEKKVDFEFGGRVVFVEAREESID